MHTRWRRPANQFRIRLAASPYSYLNNFTLCWIDTGMQGMYTKEKGRCKLNGKKITAQDDVT